MSKAPTKEAAKAPEVQKPELQPAPVPDGVIPTLQRYDDGKSLRDIGLSDLIVDTCSTSGIVNVGQLRRVRNDDLELDRMSLLDARQKVPFEVRPGEKVLVPVREESDGSVRLEEINERDNEPSSRVSGL